jgi:hypothetical protein
MFQNILVGEVRKDKENSEMSSQPHIFLAECQLHESQRSKEKESPHLKKARTHYFIYFPIQSNIYPIVFTTKNSTTTKSNIPSFSQQKTKVNTPSISPPRIPQRTATALFGLYAIHDSHLGSKIHRKVVWLSARGDHS